MGWTWLQPLVEIPHCDAGAPEPVVVADERSVVVAYYAPTTVDWNTATPEDLGEEEIIVLRFNSVHSMGSDLRTTRPSTATRWLVGDSSRTQLIGSRTPPGCVVSSA